MEWLKQKYSEAKASFQGTAQPVVDKAIAPIAPTLTTPEGAKTLGAGAEPSGVTSGGGRRHKRRDGKTRKMKKSGRKTRKH